jgi:hypothetical protein
MNMHESIRTKLALAAADALGDDERRQVEQHSRECEACRRELEVWGLYAQGLHQLPQPVLPPDLVARTQARILRQENPMHERRNGVMFCALTGYSWVIAFSVWLVARALTGGTWEVFGTNLVALGPWMFTSWVLTWITAGVAAVTLGNRYQARRVL